MKDWTEEKAEAIVDGFVADDTPNDLLRLQNAIAAALLNACEKGRKQNNQAM
jgi:hypothetical protein